MNVVIWREKVYLSSIGVGLQKNQIAFIYLVYCIVKSRIIWLSPLLRLQINLWDAYSTFTIHYIMQQNYIGIPKSFNTLGILLLFLYCDIIDVLCYLIWSGEIFYQMDEPSIVHIFSREWKILLFFKEYISF